MPFPIVDALTVNTKKVTVANGMFGGRPEQRI